MRLLFYSPPTIGLKYLGRLHRLTEPLILILIILNAVVLTIQAFPPLTLPASQNPALPPPVKGYFHTWEDYTLFALFIIFTYVTSVLFLIFFFVSTELLNKFNNSLEAFARICVNGFLFDPQVYIFGSSPSPLQSEPYTPTPGGVGVPLPGATGTAMAEMTRQTTLNRSRSIAQRFRRLQRNLLRPFALASRAPSPPPPHFANGGDERSEYPYEATPVDGGLSTAKFETGHLNDNLNTNGITTPNHNQAHHHDTNLTSQLADAAHRAHAIIREPSEPTYLSRVMRSDAKPPGTGNPNPNWQQVDSLSLPFRLSISHHQFKTQRNVPYLRQSWTRIDFLAIVCFWIMFGLATAGFEHRDGLHVGVFRAISVIRTARLLSVTSGTTVSS